MEPRRGLRAAGGLGVGVGGAQSSSVACKGPSEQEGQDGPVFPALGSVGTSSSCRIRSGVGAEDAQACSTLTHTARHRPPAPPTPDTHTPHAQSPGQARPDLHPPPT